MNENFNIIQPKTIYLHKKTLPYLKTKTV